MGVIGSTLCMHGCVEPVVGGMYTEAPFKSNDISEEFITDVLQEDGTIPPGVNIRSLESKPFGIGEGLLSVMYRLTLTYDTSPDPAWPTTLVCKLTPPAAKPRIVGELFKLFEREVQWYSRGMSAKSGLPAPVVHYAAHGGYGRYIIVMQDMATFSFDGKACCTLDQMAGVSLQHTQMVVALQAQLHAQYYGRVESVPELEGLLQLRDDAHYMSTLKGAFHDAVQELSDERWQAFRLDPTEMQPLRQALKYLDETFDDFTKEAMNNFRSKHAHAQYTNTVIHGDCRGENMFINAGCDGIKVIDYQLVAEGVPASDLAYYMITSVTVELRRQHEAALLMFYFEQMQKHGATTYCMEELLITYQRAIFIGIVIYAIAMKDALTDSERAIQLMNVTCKRINAMVNDWNIAEASDLHYSKLDDDGVTSKYTLAELKQALPKHVHAFLPAAAK